MTLSYDVLTFLCMCLFVEKQYLVCCSSHKIHRAKLFQCVDHVQMVLCVLVCDLHYDLEFILP